MGQQDSKPEVAQTKVMSPRRIIHHETVNSQVTKNSSSRVECEGMLKLQTTPFKNSIQIQTETEILFLQNVEITLQQLLQHRLHTNKLFMIEDIEKLVEAVTFTLANLQERGVTYKDISSSTIFYDSGNFKLLPNELILSTTYQKLKQNSQAYPSPELIIALRCGEDDVQDEDILEKSNVFTLGMMLLEVATLLPSTECYDSDNYDILDSVINERIVLVEEYYGQKIARIIANMLDYDYTERMTLRDLSIWVNRQFAPSRVSEQTDNATVSSMLLSKAEKTIQPKVIPVSEDKGKSRIKQAKNNSVYMGVSNNDVTKDQRNKIYINDNSRLEETSSRLYPNDSKAYLKRSNYPSSENLNKITLQRASLMMNPTQSFSDMDSFKLNQSLDKESKQPHAYQYCEDYKMKKDGLYDKMLIDKETTTKRIAKDQINPFRNSEENRVYVDRFVQTKVEKAPLRQVSNQFYPKIEEVMKAKVQSNNGIDIKSPMGESGSLNRIKEQILKSRKLIQEFKRSENSKY